MFLGGWDLSPGSIIVLFSLGDVTHRRWIGISGDQEFFLDVDAWTAVAEN